VELRVQATPDCDAVCAKFKPEDRNAFWAGFTGNAEPPKGIDPEGTPGKYVVWARDYLAGKNARKRHPDSVQRLKGRTGADGTVSFELDIGRCPYFYWLTARRTEGGFAQTSVSYVERQPGKDPIKTLVWAAQPVYRPGSRVDLKGVVRRMGRTGPRLLEGGSAEVEVRSVERKVVVWKGRCRISATGSFSTSFPIPDNAPLDKYTALVDGRIASPYAPFSVEEFRLPPFHVGLDLDTLAVRGGGKLAGTVSVGYFNGTPAKGAEIEVRMEGIARRTEKLTADAAGRGGFELSVPAVKRDRWVDLVISAKDESGRSCHALQRVAVKAAAFQLLTDVFPVRAKKGEDVRVRITARRWDGSLIPGAEISAQGFSAKARTDRQGRAELRLKAARNGYQTFQLSASAGRDRVAVRAGRRPVPGEVAESGGVRVRAPRETELGRDLELKLEVAGERERGVLIFVENTRLLAYHALKLKPGEHRLGIPTEPDFAPNVYVSVLTAKPGGYDRGARLEARVVPLQKFLTLEVTPDRAEYRPGDRCRVKVRALDWKGAAVPGAEISLGVVSGAVYELRADPTPDIRDFFCRYRLPHWPVSGTAYEPVGLEPLAFWQGPRYAWGYLVSKVLREDAISDIPLGGTGVTGVMGVGGGGMAGVFGYRSAGGRRRMIARFGGCAAAGRRLPPRVRKDFRNTAHWVAALVTDRRGEARASFDLPDDIGAWRFTARGVTADTKVGQVRVERRTLLPLEVDLVLPRAIREGDRIELGAIVRNNRGASRDARVSWSGDAGRGGRRLRIGRGGCRRLAIEYRPAEAGERIFRAKVVDLGGREADAAERKVQVLPRGYPTTRSFSGTLAGGGRIPIRLRSPRKGTIKMVLTAESGLAGPLESALDGLINYPYGCVEQTMSRFMPAAIAGRAMKRAGLKCRQAAKLPKVLNRSLERLAGYQHDDGGWGWWKHDATNDFMTAYVLEGLCLSRQCGHAVPEPMIERAERYLFAQLSTGKLDRSRTVSSIGACDVKLYAARALALRYGQDRKKFAGQIKRLLPLLPGGKLKSGDRLLRADALRLLGKRDDALDEFNVASRGMVVDGSSRRGIIAASRVLEVGAAVAPEGTGWAGLARQVVLARRGSGWGDTQATAAAVRGLSAVLGAAEGKPGTVNVLVDGREVGRLKPAKNACRTMVLTKELAGAGEVALVPQGGGAGFWSAQLSGWTSEAPVEPAHPAAAVKCRYFLNGGDRRSEIKTDPAGRLAVPAGRTVEIVMECELKKNLSYLRVSLPRPCGAELVRKPKLEGGVCAFEERDDGLHFFARHWARGKHQLRLEVRAETPGDVFAPPPELAPMYGDPVPVSVKAPVRWVISKQPRTRRGK
jgi:hypothetical protein